MAVAADHIIGFVKIILADQRLADPVPVLAAQLILIQAQEV